MAGFSAGRPGSRDPVARHISETAALSGSVPPDRAPRQAIRFRDSLVVVLALTTGALDAVTFLRLGKVFSSVITGNLALLGVAAGQQNLSLAENGGLALAGYGLGVLIGGAIAGVSDSQQPVWPPQVTVALAAELLVLAGFSGGWLAAGGHPAGGGRLVLLIAVAAAMGMQSTAARRLGQMSTTYLTSTLTGLLQALAVRRWPSEWQRSTGVLAAFIVGAVIGAVAALRSPSWVPAAVLIPLAAVVLCSVPAAARSARSLSAGHGFAARPVLFGKEIAQRLGEVVQLGQMRFGEVGDQPVAFLCEFHPHYPGIIGVGPPAHEPGAFRPVHQAHGAMALQQQVIGKLPDGRGLRAWVPLDGHEQLVLSRGKARRARLLLAPSHEAPQRHAEAQAVPEVVVSWANGTLPSAGHEQRIVSRHVGRSHRDNCIALRHRLMACPRETPGG